MGLAQDDILDCFISGLAPEVINKMTIHKHVSISQAVGLAKLIKAKLKDVKPKFQKLSTPFNCTNPPYKTHTFQNPKTQPFPQHTSNPKPLSTPLTTQTTHKIPLISLNTRVMCPISLL